jgi:biotin carboxyl carrier protein/ketosteroid isomerase-like protein
LSHEQAALFFGCPVGTVKSRLSRARARLRRRLICRGLAPPDHSNIIALVPAALPRGLAEATNQAAQAWVMGQLSTTQIISASVSALTEGVLWTMFLTKFKVTAAAILLIGAGSAVLVSQATAQRLSAPHVTVANPGQTAEGAREAPVSEDVLDLEMLERAWVDAGNRRDMAVVRRIIADDFSTIDSAGNTSNRADYLLGVLNGVSSNHPIALDEIKTRVFGETAAITSRIKIKTAPSSGRMTNVYVKRLGHWRCVASHTSGVVMRTCPAINTTKGREQLFNQTAAGQPSTQATQRTELSINCMTCHEASHQVPSGAGQSDANVLYQPNTFKAPNPGQEIRIRPRFECLVERIYVNRGESVKKGAPLIGLSSIELASAKNDYLTKEVQSKHDRRILEMRRKLFATKAISEQALTDTQNNGEKSKLEVQVARDKLKFLGLNDEAIERVGTEDGKQKAQLTLRAPMDGTISKVDAELGNLYDIKSVLLILNATSSGQSTQP